MLNDKKVTRKRPVQAAIRQARWFVWRLASEKGCCFCGKILFHGMDLKHMNNITIHHIEGDYHADDYTKPAPVSKMLFAHSACHKAYHLLDRMREQGKKIDRKRLAEMNRTVKFTIKQEKRK